MREQKPRANLIGQANQVGVGPRRQRAHEYARRMRMRVLRHFLHQWPPDQFLLADTRRLEHRAGGRHERVDAVVTI